MRVVLTEAARRYLTRELRLKDSAVFVHQFRCPCGGLQPEVSLGSRSDISPALLNAYFEEIANVDSASIFLDKRLKDYFGASILTIDADQASGGRQLKLAVLNPYRP